MNDGNLLPKPLQVTSMKFAVAERADIIVDFNKLTAAGGAAQGATRLWLENRLVQTKGEGPDDRLNEPHTSRQAMLIGLNGASDETISPGTSNRQGP